MGGGGRIGLLQTGNLYIDCNGDSLPPKGVMVVDGDSGLSGTIGGSAGLGCSCGTSCNFSLIVLPLAPALPLQFSR